MISCMRMGGVLLKKGINIWSFPADLPVQDCIRLAARAGFDGIELALNESGPLSLESDPKELDGYRLTAQQEGLEICSVATGLYWTWSLTSACAETRRKALAVARRQIDTAVRLGADTILVVPGAVGVDFIPGCETVPYDEAYARSTEMIGSLVEDAARSRISIGLENVWNKFLLSPLEMRSFIDQFASPFVGAYFDVGNSLAWGYPEHWIRILGKRIRKVHFKDYRRQVGGVAGFVDLLAGDVNFPAVVDALHAVGYSSYATAEMVPPAPFYRYYPDQLIRNTSQSMDRILGIGTPLQAGGQPPA